MPPAIQAGFNLPILPLDFKYHHRDIPVGAGLILQEGGPYIGHDAPKGRLFFGCRGSGTGRDVAGLDLNLHIWSLGQIPVPARISGSSAAGSHQYIVIAVPPVDERRDVRVPCLPSAGGKE